MKKLIAPDKDQENGSETIVVTPCSTTNILLFPALILDNTPAITVITKLCVIPF